VTTAFRLDDTPLTRAERTAVARVASRAFVDDPFYRYLCPDDAQRARALVHLVRAAVAHPGPRARGARVRGDDGAIVAASLWIPTGGFPPPVGSQLAQLPGALAAFARRPRALLRANAYVATTLRAHPKEPHWYLSMLVVDPPWQRHGLGTLLMDSALATVDAEGVGAYLETQREENLAYYGRFGFVPGPTLTPRSDAPPLFSMWREPRETRT
jgi:GNAT superfamily N-acetyltransferase